MLLMIDIKRLSLNWIKSALLLISIRDTNLSQMNLRGVDNRLAWDSSLIIWPNSLCYTWNFYAKLARMGDELSWTVLVNLICWLDLLYTSNLGLNIGTGHGTLRAVFCHCSGLGFNDLELIPHLSSATLERHYPVLWPPHVHICASESGQHWLR